MNNKKVVTAAGSIFWWRQDCRDAWINSM